MSVDKIERKERELAILYILREKLVERKRNEKERKKKRKGKAKGKRKEKERGKLGKKGRRTTVIHHGQPRANAVTTAVGFTR